MSLDSSRLSELESSISAQSEQLLLTKKKNEDLASKLEISMREHSKQSQEFQQVKAQMEFLQINLKNKQLVHQSEVKKLQDEIQKLKSQPASQP